MKIVNKIILSAVAAAALVFATACSNDYTVEEYDAGEKVVLNKAQIIEKILEAQGGGAAKQYTNHDLNVSAIQADGATDGYFTSGTGLSYDAGYIQIKKSTENNGFRGLKFTTTKPGKIKITYTATAGERHVCVTTDVRTQYADAEIKDTAGVTTASEEVVFEADLPTPSEYIISDDSDIRILAIRVSEEND